MRLVSKLAFKSAVRGKDKLQVRKGYYEEEEGALRCTASKLGLISDIPCFLLCLGIYFHEKKYQSARQADYHVNFESGFPIANL